MQSKFIPTLQVGNGYSYLKLKGILDEDNLLSNFLGQIQGRLLLIDMAEIERINSCGVRDWVNWLNQIQALGVAVILLRCSPVVVSQANMVTNFAADAFIHSFYAPYVHPDTGDEQSVLLFTEDIRQNQPIRAPKIFNESGEELEFDEFEESYFAFISDPRIMNYQIASDIQAVIQYFLPEAATRQPVISARPQASVQASPYASQGQGMVGGGQMGGSPYGQQPMGGYGASQQNPYASGMNPAEGGYGQQAMNGGYPYGGQMGGNPYGQPSSPAPMPQGMPMRHEQPPLPSSNNYQQAPMGQPPMGGMPMGGSMASQAPMGGMPMGGSMASPAPMGGSMASPAPMGGSMASQAPMGGSMASQAPMGGSMASQAPMGGMPMGGSMASQAPMGGMPMGGSMASQAPMGGSMASSMGSEPRPAPQPVSPLAAQSMARNAQNMQPTPSMPYVPVQMKTMHAPPTPKWALLSGDDPKKLKERKIIFAGLAGIVVLIIIFVVILVIKGS